MLIIDNAVLAPFKGFFWLAREIRNAAIQESKNEAEAIRLELSQLYRDLETGQISDTDFDLREQRLLDRLDAAEGQGGPDEEAQEEEDSDPDSD